MAIPEKVKIVNIGQVKVSAGRIQPGVETEDSAEPLSSTSQCWNRAGYENRFTCGAQEAEEVSKIGVGQLGLLTSSVITSDMDNNFSDRGGQGAQKFREFI